VARIEPFDAHDTAGVRRVDELASVERDRYMGWTGRRCREEQQVARREIPAIDRCS
jgi:hypothetical protein